ncbi:MAG: ABC transporter substrate-binding protein [Gammaproteobacteria bacterium]|nr:ABC transporter substrate-binding protein [Gammaproteobacteria bacterium]
MKKLPLMALLLGGFLLAGGTASASGETAPVAQNAATAAAPRQVIEHLDDALLTAMKQAKMLGYAGRYRNLAPVIEHVYDFPSIAALVLGSHWAKLSPAQQKEFIATLAHYTIATYAARFDGYAGERFAIKSVESMRPSAMAVYSTITEANGKVHSLDYLLQPVDGQWRVINVVADGVSDLALKRAEFTHLLESKGYPGLIAGLKSYIARMAHGGE